MCVVNIREDIQDMIDDFSFLDDWEDRYMHVIELGKALPVFSSGEQISANKVNGCTSQVWLIAEQSQDNPARICYRGDSDAHIVKGLVAIVIQIFSGQTAQDIVNTDAPKIIAALGLSEHLSTQRANGLNAMIARIQQGAHAILQST